MNSSEPSDISFGVPSTTDTAGPVDSTGAGHIPSLHRQMGLDDNEFAAIRAILGRDPNHLELAMYAVMWSEHCSYKSSRLHLRRLPSEGKRVIVGPGENAGVLDVGDGIAIAVRIESHNHPSAIEPYQGAATGVGGILRDIFTMGARPIAVMDSLYFGPLDNPRNRWVMEGVVGGISGYGNSVGVPTVGGELSFASCYEGNPLVNVLCLGVLPVERLVLGRASGVGNLAVLMGSRTGRDGIGGVSVLASAGFKGDSGGGGPEARAEDSKRPSVQVGDPFEEKRLIEACLEILDAGLAVGLQDLGGAGLACATSETAARAGMGMDVDVSAVPLRESNMEPYEVMTSESQERMLAIVEPEKLSALEEVCRRWEVHSSVVGRVVPPDQDGIGYLRVRYGWKGQVLAEIPAASLSQSAPCYARPIQPPAKVKSLAVFQTEKTKQTSSTGAKRSSRVASSSSVYSSDLLRLIAEAGDPEWVYSQYDHQLFLNTVVGPGDDATLLRLAAPGIPWKGSAVALSVDGNPRWCALDPRAGTAATVAESVLNVACVGGRPIGLVNCLNFGNPEHPEVMWQLSEAIDGMAEACRAFDLPVVGGNVSLYNESSGIDIMPTPVIGVVGLVDQVAKRPPGARLLAGSVLLMLGTPQDQLEGSRWATELHPTQGTGMAGDTALFSLDMGRVVGLARFVAELVAEQVAQSTTEPVVTGIHDVSAGGLGVCLAEMAMRSSTGAVVNGISGHEELFSEAPCRVVLGISPSAVSQVVARAVAQGIQVTELGVARGDRLVIEKLVDLDIEELLAARKEPLALAFAH
ncbi:MAG: phosphoribosylformylglycinamidine synthase subunit PurL [Actinobacteria bacterium]|nr:phosphoribosylformylglycinamidine synthase subunit PurL [Actinomycetota bacterium]